MTTGYSESFSSNSILGFYWGNAEVLKPDSTSMFTNDLQHCHPQIVLEWSFMLISTIWTTVWIIHHTTSVPHFKFEFQILSKICIRTHILVGSIEYILLTILYFIDSSPVVLYMVYVTISLDMIHELTASYLAPSTFGQKFLTFPGHIWIIAMKTAMALYFLAEPLSRTRFMALYISHSQFSWLRLLYYVFMRLHLFRDSLYTAGMVVTTVLCQSLISGANGPLIYLLYIVCATHLCRKYKPRCVVGGYQERGRSVAKFISDEKLDLLMRSMRKGASLDFKAKMIFEFMDTDDTGFIEFSEISVVFMNCGVSMKGTQRIFDAMDEDENGMIGLKEFVDNRNLRAFVKQFEEDIIVELKERAKMNAREGDVRDMVGEYSMEVLEERSSLDVVGVEVDSDQIMEESLLLA